MVNTNVLAASLLVRLFCNGMLERNRGHIINISSIAAKQRYPGEFGLDLQRGTYKARYTKVMSHRAKSPVIGLRRPSDIGPANAACWAFLL